MVLAWVRSALPSLNESPSEKEGKFAIGFEEQHFFLPLNESPSEKEGKSRGRAAAASSNMPSMKVPPKRKGNTVRTGDSSTG